MLFFLSAELWKHSSWLTQRPAASCIMCKLETGGTQDCRVISHKRFQTTTWQKLIHNMPTVDISETNTRQMEREFTKLYLEPQNWWVWGRLGQSDGTCIFFALAAYGWSCCSTFVKLLKNIEPQCASRSIAYLQGVIPLAGSTKLGRLQGRGQTKSNKKVWRSNVGARPLCLGGMPKCIVLYAFGGVWGFI